MGTERDRGYTQAHRRSQGGRRRGTGRSRGRVCLAGCGRCRLAGERRVGLWGA